MPDLFDARPGSYWICFDGVKLDPEYVQGKIVSLPEIVEWWNQLPNLYVVRSNLEREDFFRLINRTFETGHYLMASLEGRLGGRLSFPQWKGLLNADQETIRALEVSAVQEAERRKKEIGKN